MNKALLKATFKANYKVLLILFLVMLMYSSIIITMYDPNSMDAWDAMLDLMPEQLISAMNFVLLAPTFLGYVAGYYYGFIMVMFPMIYSIILGQRVIARYVDNGSMSFLLSTPISRKKVAITQGFYVLTSTITLILVTALLILLFGEIMFPGDMELVPFTILNLNMISLFVAISGITYLASCIFNDKSQAIGFGSGIPIGFFVIDMLVGASDKLSILKYFTIFTLMNPEMVLDKDPFVFVNIAILLVIGFGAYVAGIIIFNRKDLHI